MENESTAAPAVDVAMGLELEAIDLENELEWAEAQGRTGDAARLRQRLAATLAALADVADAIAAGGAAAHVPTRKAA